MSTSDPQLLTFEILCLVLGIGIAVGGGLLALVGDAEKPLQFIPIFLVAVGLFLGGMALVCWYRPIAGELKTRLTDPAATAAATATPPGARTTS